MSIPAPIFYLSSFLIVSTFIPLIRHDFWIFRVFEYPRLQKLTLNLVLVLTILSFYFPDEIKDQVMTGLLLLNVAYLIYQVYPFTVFGNKQIVKSRSAANENNLRMLIANVYQDNRQSNDYHELIRQCDPDLILMVETNKWWEEQLSPISKDYPHQLKAPLENTYGMLLYSRFPFENGSINYLVEDDIPSIEADVKLKSGQLVRLYCLHPQPPVPQENPRSTERDKEILMVAEKAKSSKLPVVVAGDLNDVAWSYTTELFSKISGLLDPRRGRGFFNSFNAKYFFMRFPLDHAFISTDMKLKHMRRLDNFNSDHFPIFISLQYEKNAKFQQEEMTPDADDLEIAAEKKAAV